VPADRFEELLRGQQASGSCHELPQLAETAGARG
jgi:hypothetical protein